MDIKSLLIFGANSYVSQKILNKLNFDKIICISKNLKIKSRKKNIIIFKDLKSNEEKISKYISKRTSVIFFNNLNFDNLIINKKRSELKKELDASIFNVFDNTKIILKYFIKSGGGSFIFVGSSRGLSSDIGISGYSISKNALVGLMNSIAEEYSSFGIRSNYLSLGYFDSPLFNKIQNSKKLINKTLIKKKGKFESILYAIEFLSKADYVTKSIVKVDGGYK